MRAPRTVLASACLLAAAALLAGCGGSGSSDSTASRAEAAPSRPAPPARDFPVPHGRSLEEVIKNTEAHTELLLSPAAMVFYPGENRYPFGVSERDGKQISDAEVALYYAKIPTPKAGAKAKPGSKGPVAEAQSKALKQPAVGPFPVKIETLATDPAFRSQAPAGEIEPAAVVYSAQIDFPSAGAYRMAAVIERDGEEKGTLLPSAEVGEFTNIPRPGEKPPRISTPTVEGVGGDLSKITTRVPPERQNKVDYADALGKEPIMLLFATPKFCQSRVCGPVVDVAEQAQREYGDEAAFIHMEIYNDNDPNKGVRPQVRAFHLPTEPWLFAINREGVVSSVIEGAFGLELMDKTAEKLVAE